jgi:HrpA-like RNA helicase
MTVAQRVAQELGCEPGTLVGHRVRFDDCTDVQGRGTTQIIYATDGMLLREATADPLLTRYAAVVSDVSCVWTLRWGYVCVCLFESVV